MCLRDSPTLCGRTVVIGEKGHIVCFPGIAIEMDADVLGTTDGSPCVACHVLVFDVDVDDSSGGWTYPFGVLESANPVVYVTFG